MVEAARTSLIVIQPTPFCNIDCAYCYLPDRGNKSRISIDDIGFFFDKIFRFPTLSTEVTIVWHAGEPLVLGPDYYRSAFEVIEAHSPPNIKIYHSFQTNGVLLDERWCRLIGDWGVGVGLSIDGPREIHDKYRKTRGGRGTFEMALKGLHLLKTHAIPYHVISVLTKSALEEPEKMFDFYERHEIHEVGFNIDELEGANKSSSLSHEEAPALMKTFLRRFAKKMASGKGGLRVRELEETTNSLLYLDNDGPINNLVLPFGIITVTLNGDVSTFSPELSGFSTGGFDSFFIGNLYRDGFDDLMMSNNLTRMTAKIHAGVERCKLQCPYFGVCGGGTPSNKIFELGTFDATETLHCKLTKQIVADFIIEAAENIVV